ncbi:conserved hypothetical protein [Streptococcus equi subsp. zooepidemicus ATCC 35246]|nr:conserved hypothetical protein [Streptococcus equi subsp. zooepidemicus ATCC 35246]
MSFEEAHQVGVELCEKILEGKYEYILATHIDKDHIHNVRPDRVLSKVD